MIITPKKIEMWKQEPKLYDYDRGYHNGSMDAWNEPKPMTFTNEHSRAFRRGYRQGWAEQKAHLLKESSDEQFGKLVHDEYNKVCILTMQTALVPDSDVPEYFKDDWHKVIYMLNHPEEVKSIKRIVARDGKIISKEGYDNG